MTDPRGRSWQYSTGISLNGFDFEKRVSSETPGAADLPLVSVVFLAYNRRRELLRSLAHMINESGYPPAALEVLVVDNASADGTAEAVAESFPDVRLVRNEDNLGAPGWNAGFALARGSYVLILDDDAYLRPGDLERAVRAAEEEHAGLVSFSVVSSFEPDRRLNDDWPTGLLSFWGCAALVSRDALGSLGGYDPNIFIWANEVDLTMRLLDRGFRHLHLPDVCAIHMKERIVTFEPRRYLVNARHHGYIAGKLLRPADAAAVVFNIAQQAAVDTFAQRRMAIGAVKEVLAGLWQGWRAREPVRPVVSRAYRDNFHAFAGPWPFTRSVRERFGARGSDAEVAHQREDRTVAFYRRRAAFYPTGRASLKL
jgi:GT2 family glycosyltransferase